ncbi:MAG: hypothetical protein R3F35_16455 [Myxococcota bacterium]
MRAGRRLVLAVWTTSIAGCGEPPVLEDCLPNNGMRPICLFQAPEDLAVVGHWLILSQMPTPSRPGSLLAFHPESATVRRLYPPAGAVVTQPPAGADAAAAPGAAADGSAKTGCGPGGPPTFDDFAPHGIDVSGTRLLVVDHGSREGIEAFTLSADRGGPVVTWKGCTPLPDDVAANDVVALDDGGFAVTKMVERPQWLGIAKLVLGLKTGALLRHGPADVGFTVVPNTAGQAPNGVEVDAEGRFWIAEWTGHRVVRVAPDGSTREVVALDFSPDNLAWSADGRLLVTGQRASVFDVPGCAAIERGTCALPAVVVAVDPVSLEVHPIVDDDPPTVLGPASIAVELDGDLWIGGFAGNRLVRREGVR